MADRLKKRVAKLRQRAEVRSSAVVSPRGLALLRDPLLNRGTAFTDRERDTLGLRGLLPAHVLSMKEQAERVLTNLRRLPSDLDKYVFLNSLHDRNEALFFRVVCDNIDEIMPLIYTPTVGLACQQFGHIYQRPRGLFIGANDCGRIAKLLRNWPYPAKLIVVTDGERILGLGDLGANGMGIPVGKLSLYSACAGVHPKLCLPVMLDVGTNNEALLNDPYYIGLRQKRLSGSAYDALVDEFISAARKVFPGVLIQFEDFANHAAFRLLHKYRDRACVFNDDIQGTAAVVLAGLFSALRVTGGKLADQTLLFLGAGEAATGIANLVVSAMMAQGVSEAEARKRVWLFDSRGLVVKNRAGVGDHKIPFAHEHAPIGGFVDAIRSLKPTAIIGVAAVGGTFTPEVLQTMGQINQQPIIFALSNPTSQAECSAEEAYRHTGGRALFACGSPYDPVMLGNRTFVPRQGNNSYIFPGVGLGAIASGARLITDEMFMSAAVTLAKLVTQEDLDQGSLYPALPRIREVSAHIAAAVAQVVYKRGLATGKPPKNLPALIREHMYDPRY
ncbi:MAG TPA: NAD-dependent malic enzyme [Stellaceae bacterium]|nr:NAD-dependent malic enzyme [Stellaceae bacterium]